MSYLRDRKAELTGYQEGEPWSPKIDLQCDFVMVYRIDDTTEERIRKFREKGYVVHLMAGSAWGKYQDYLNGKWDGRDHWDESQTDRSGSAILHGKDTPYMVPTIAFSDYLSEKLRAAVDAGVEAIHLEEPEFWDHGGYSEAFKREYRLYYREEWQPPHSSPEAHYKASRLKARLYARLLDRVSASLKEYAMTRYHRVLRFYVPTHSLLNYTQWKIMSPEAALTELPGVDGYIAQIWTGTARTPNAYEGVIKERTFETAYLEYGIMQELVKGTGRTMWFLHDPVEDWPEYTWEDYRRNYLKTVAASLLHPAVCRYEVCPWPARVMNGIYPQKAGLQGGVIPDGRMPDSKAIPPEYASLLAGMIQMLGDMDQKEVHFHGIDSGVGVLTADSGMFQRTYPDEQVTPELAAETDRRLTGYAGRGRDGNPCADESRRYLKKLEQEEREFLAFRASGAYPDFFGLVLPLLKYGLPVRPVQLDNIRRFPGYLSDYRTLILSYEGMKPETPDCNTALAAWIMGGGTLIYIGDGSDPYHKMPAWWNRTEHPYRNPAEHLFESAGLPRNPKEGIYGTGKGIIAIYKEAPARICLTQERAARYREFVKKILAEAGETWNYSNFLSLQRGPYRICSVMNESISEEPAVLTGLFADMLDPEYPVITHKSIAPDESAVLFDFQMIEGENIRIVGTSARISELKTAGEEIELKAKAADGIQVSIRLRLPGEVRRLQAESESGPVDIRWKWDERSSTVLIRYFSENQEVHIRGIL